MKLKSKMKIPLNVEKHFFWNPATDSVDSFEKYLIVPQLKKTLKVLGFGTT